MKVTATIEDPRFARRPVSPFIELGAYEALWTEPKASFKWIADKFREHPGALPSEFVPPDVAIEHAERARKILSDAGVSHFAVRVHGDGEYPEKLRSAAHPVELLYFQGSWQLAQSRSLTVIGTREPSEEGRARAKKLARRLVEDDFTVISGLAKGIDAVVHQTAIENGGRTIGVIGTPLSVHYPKENAGLQDLIAHKHLLISQVPVIRYHQVRDFRLNRFFFVERNITMSALAEATVIVEAGETSGTLVSARHALKYGRKLFILDSNFKNPALTWPQKFEQLGATRVREYEDIQNHMNAPKYRHREQ